METNLSSLVQREETTQFLVADGIGEDKAQMKNAPESAELGASFAACATPNFTNQYSTEPLASQIAAVPTLQEIENEIATAARTRIEATLHELSDTRTRIERERTARETALKAAQERVSETQGELDGIATERKVMEHRAQTFLKGGALKLAMGKIHLGFNAKQLELEDTLAMARTDVGEIEEELQATAVADALEIQLAEEYLGQLETAAPDVAQVVRLAASADENIAAARQAIADGRLQDAAVLLEKAKVGNADPSRVAQVEHELAKAKQEKKAQELIARMNAFAGQPRAVRRIKRLIAEAEALGVSNRVKPAAKDALRIAREAANARFKQARPIVDHLVAEGFAPVVGDGRIEAWKEISKKEAANRTHHGSTWTLDRVMILRGDAWETKTPRVPVTRREPPKRAQLSRTFSSPPASEPAPTN